MSGFIQRFGEDPGVEVVTQIEGVTIIDLPPPGSIQGVGTGIAGLAGEFVDMTYAVAVGVNGDVTPNPRPVQILSAADMIDKVGGFDETLGQFGGDQGNGFVELRNKSFSGLVLVPVNLASSKGVRLWRDLPTCTSATNPSPVVPIQPALVSAGREFRTSNNRVRTAIRVTFFGDISYAQGTDVDPTAAGAPAATQSLTIALDLSVVAAGVTKVIEVGDAFVLGVIGGAGALGANAGTYRVVSFTFGVGTTTIVLEKPDGSTFDWTTGVNLPYRLHSARTWDSAPKKILSAVGGYLVPARPLDATIAADVSLTPTVVPPAATATVWDPLSGLTMRTMPVSGLTYTAAVQAPNAVNSASVDALYVTAINAFLSEGFPARTVNILWAARKSSLIRTTLRTAVLSRSQRGLGLTTPISPEVDTVSVDTVVGDADPGVGANRDERVDFAWPGIRTFIPEAVNLSLGTADGLTTADGILDTTSDGWLVSILSRLAPERNPGQSLDPVPTIMSQALAIQRGVRELTRDDYVLFRQRGIVAPRVDDTVGMIFQSGITTSLLTGRKNINRRRMADFIEDSVARALKQFTKLPLTNNLKDAATLQVVGFLNQLLSPNNPASQRIKGFQVDDKSGNTLALEAQGIFTLIIKVRTLATADFIKLQAEIGESVLVPNVSEAA